MTRPKASQREAWTPLGAGWWDWLPLAQASAAARLLWLSLYSSAPARRCPPGLWQGGTAVMAEVVRLELAQVEHAFVELGELRLVEGDPATRVVRLTVLPDYCDRPHNGDQIRSWWRRWCTLPQCTVRDSHVDTLRDLVGRFTKHHKDAWDETFATVPTPLRVPARPPLGHGAPHGGGHRVPSPHVAEIAGPGHRVPHGGGHRQGEGEGSSSSIPESGSHRSSREISNSSPGSSVIEDPTLAADVDASWESWERRCGEPPVVDLGHEGVRRFGPLHAALPDAPTASSERFK